MQRLTKENKNVIGYVIIGLCLTILGVSIVSALALKGEKVDPETFCREDISAHTIVVLDKTDSLSVSQQKFALDYVNKEKDALNPFEKFSILTLTEDTYTALEPAFSMCNPGTGKEANQLYQNPRKIQMRFDEFFSKPLRENLQDALSEETGARSPIFEMIRELSFRADFDKRVEKKTLIIISDLMHHTPEYSHYKSRIDYEYFAKQPYADEVAANLNSVEVKIVYLLRDNLGSIQGERHLSFWKKYFESMGAEVAEVRKIR